MSWRPPTLADAARRINAGEREDLTLCDFLSEFYGHLRRGDLDIAQLALTDEPEALADPIAHAHMGAVGEHLALRWGLKTPTWTNDPSRFLKRPHFMTPLEGFKAMYFAQSPLAYRRRLIFTEAEPLRRAAMPRAPGGRPLERHEIAQGHPIPPRRIPREKPQNPGPGTTSLVGVPEGRIAPWIATPNFTDSEQHKL